MTIMWLFIVVVSIIFMIFVCLLSFLTGPLPGLVAIILHYFYIPMLCVYLACLIYSIRQIWKQSDPKTRNYFKVPVFINVLTLFVGYGIYSLASPIYIDSDGLKVDDPQYSPDKQKAIVCFARDIGALGYSAPGYSVMDADSLSSNLRTYQLPGEYSFPNWVDSKNIEVTVNVKSCEIDNEDYIPAIKTINGVNIIVIEKGFETHLPLFCEGRFMSPDKKHEVVAYRYGEKYSRMNLHVSIINAGEKLPSIGNIFIGAVGNDLVCWAKWNNSKKLELHTTPFYSYLAERNLQARIDNYFGINPNISVSLKTLDVNTLCTTDISWGRREYH